MSNDRAVGTPPNPRTTRIELIGGPTTLIEIGGIRLLTDPTFDPPGDYPSGTRTLTKTIGPARSLTDIGNVDAVLLSHDQHADNLDTSGRKFLSHVPTVLSTPAAAKRLQQNTVGLSPWQTTTLPLPNNRTLTVTATPAQHWEDTEGTTSAETEKQFLSAIGEVTGFVLSSQDLPTVYISGDNASLHVVQEVANRIQPIDIAILFAGAAKTAISKTHLTLTAPLTAQAAHILASSTVIPVHTEGWAHFSQGPDFIPPAFAGAGLSERLVLLSPGESYLHPETLSD